MKSNILLLPFKAYGRRAECCLAWRILLRFLHLKSMKVPTMPFMQGKNVPKLCTKQTFAVSKIIKVNQYNWDNGLLCISRNLWKESFDKVKSIGHFLRLLCLVTFSHKMMNYFGLLYDPNATEVLHWQATLWKCFQSCDMQEVFI